MLDIILKKRFTFALLTVFLWLIPQVSMSCTSFCLKEDKQLVFGKNFDWFKGAGLVSVNKRNVFKPAFSARTGGQPAASWTSKYGSITFSMAGHEFPMGGINETGLVVESMVLDKNEYPPADSRPAVGLFQWVQYQLDNFSSIDEVITSDSEIRVVNLQTNKSLHYLVCDKSGECTVIEFLGGKFVYYRQGSMPVQVLANHPYKESVNYLRKHIGFGGKETIPTGAYSMFRFVNAANKIENYAQNTSTSIIEYGFDVLSNVSQGYTTKWSIIYDIQKMRVYFKSLLNPQTRYVDLNSFNFSCAAPSKIMDINVGAAGEVSNSLSDYSTELNRNTAKNLVNVYPSDLIDAITNYPTSTFCRR